MPRSGSTLLANKLASDIDELLVLPETKALEILLFLNKWSIPNKILLALKKDPRWDNLNINESKFLQDLEKESELNPKKILDILVRSNQNFRSTKTRVLIKNGKSLYHLDKISKWFPNAMYLSLKRDPRATIHSMLNAKAAFRKDEKFTLKNSYQLIREYNQYYKKSGQIEFPICHISYEPLVLNYELVLDKILQKLALKRNPSNDRLKLSKEESELHANVNKPTDARKIDYWKESLKPIDIKVIEHLGVDHITDKTYEVSSLEMMYILAKKRVKSLWVNIAIRPMYAIKRYARKPSKNLLLHRVKIWIRTNG